MSSVGWLRRQVVGWALPRRGGQLGPVLAELEFVQADPIQAPARAQDLILRHRVTGYRAGDLERRYPSLDIDEDYLYAYGFAARRLRPLLHPRRRHRTDEEYWVPTGLAADLLAFVRERGVVHPRDAAAAFGPQQAVNGWGGTSSATTMELDRLHHYGLLRVADRAGGTRRFVAADPLGDPLDPADRVRALVMRVARTLAPATEGTLSMAVSQLVMWANVPGGQAGGRWVIRDLLARGELAAADVGGTRYVWPADLVPADGEAPARVRFLAPFDPVVWDRRRFGQLWGWDYRFEAYTPAAKRVMGYYAMPLLWRDRVIGWANCTSGGEVEVGYAGAAPPRGLAYTTALDTETARLRRFLGVS